MKIKSKLINSDENLLMRSLSVSFPSKEIRTPVKTTQKEFCQSGDINEIYFEINKLKIKAMLKDTNEEKKFNSKIANQSIKDMTNLTVLSYKEKDLPNEREMDLISDLQYVYSDAAIVPLCPNIIDSYKNSKLRSTFEKFIKLYIEAVEKLNNKTIIGIIPQRYPRQLVQSLFDIYEDNGITNLMIDSDGLSLFDNLTWLRRVQTEFHQRRFFDKGFIYNINSSQGKFLRHSSSVLAKDFINLIFGIDIIGSNHIRPVLPPDAWSRLDQNRNKNPRIFNSNRYGYIRDDSKDPSYPRAKSLNIKRQQKETQKLQVMIKEETTNIEYLNEKNEVKNENAVDRCADLKKKILSDKTTQSSLFDA